MSTNYKTQKPITDENITDTFFMVIRLGSNGMQNYDSMPTTRYDSYEEATQEAQRLAGKHPNHPRGFAVVQALCVFKGSVTVLGHKLKNEKYNSINAINEIQFAHPSEF